MRTMDTLELVGGALCLDFANTLNSRFAPEHDYLRTYADLGDWALKVGVLDPAQRQRYGAQAGREAREAGRVLKKALWLRDLCYRIFSRLASQSEPAREDLEALAGLYAEALSQAEFVRLGEAYEVAWRQGETLDNPLWPVVYSAGQLLLSKQLSQVKECPGCGWLFLDTSKNRSRRWCSMSTCGARDKMRRYHGRLRAR